jgi:hypothetical protein
MKAKRLLFASILGLASAMAVAQTGSKAAAPAPGHDMNEQNINAPGMRETMREQEAGARSGAKAAQPKGHDMNEQNTLAPDMREQMRREEGKGTTREAARAANPGHEMNEQNINAPGMREQMRKQ